MVSQPFSNFGLFALGWLFYFISSDMTETMWKTAQGKSAFLCFQNTGLHRPYTAGNWTIALPGRNTQNKAFLTTGTATWPPLLCQTLSSMVLEADPAGGIIAHSPMDTPVKQEDFPGGLPPADYNKGGNGLPRQVMGRTTSAD